MRNRLVSSAGLVAVVAAALFGSSTAAFAQEKGKVGLTMGFPSSVGILFHVTDTVAIRPEFSFAQSSTEIDGPISIGSSDSWEVGTGVSALVYLQKWDDVNVYVSPRWTYSHDSTSTSTGTEGRINTWGLMGSFGAQYGLGTRFAVFGEVGIAYSHSSLGTDVVSGGVTGSGIGTRSGVGVVVYFK